MIPKKIHYCWFGKKKKPELAEKCIKSWKKYCPDYEIIEWNEENFDINCCTYVKEAYGSKKYAFVADYVRLYALYMYGGIYMDTDVEVIRNLDEFLTHQAFAGFESATQIQTGVMAFEEKSPLVKDLMNYYENRHFIDQDGNLDTTTNVIIITDILTERGFVPNGELQVISGLTLYPKDYFCPLEDSTGMLTKTKNTATIHWFSKSWIPWHLRVRSNITRIFHRLFGVNCFAFLRKKK